MSLYVLFRWGYVCCMYSRCRFLCGYTVRVVLEFRWTYFSKFQTFWRSDCHRSHSESVCLPFVFNNCCIDLCRHWNDWGYIRKIDVKKGVRQLFIKNGKVREMFHLSKDLSLIYIGFLLNWNLIKIDTWSMVYNLGKDYSRYRRDE